MEKSGSILTVTLTFRNAKTGTYLTLVGMVHVCVHNSSNASPIAFPGL